MCVKFYAVKTDMGFVTIPYLFWEHFKLLLVSLGNLLLFLADFCVIFFNGFANKFGNLRVFGCTFFCCVKICLFTCLVYFGST